MRELRAIPSKLPPSDLVNLFQENLAHEGGRYRVQEQRERLHGRAAEVAAMLDRLDGQLSVDRERAIGMLAEYTGLLELVLEDIRVIRDLDENFGGTSKRPSPIVRLALQLERGLAYLLGIFSVVSSGEELPVYNWKLIQRDVQEVLTVSQTVRGLAEPTELLAA